MISYGKQNISQEDIESVVKVLNSDFLNQYQSLKKHSVIILGLAMPLL